MIFLPIMKRWGRPKQQGLCSQSIHLWATSNFVPCSKALGTPPDGNNYVANLPTCGPHLILFPAVKRRGPAMWYSYVANLPTCGPLLILTPALKHWEPSGRHGLYSQSTQLWATRDILPH